MNQAVKTYYDELANSYDQNRFFNSYGEFIDKQEKDILTQFLVNHSPEFSLDVACGTGRFLEYSFSGIDLSENMIEQAKKKFPSRKLSCQPAHSTNFKPKSFKTITCFHLFMHLEKELIHKILDEFYRLLPSSGIVILDVPSTKRRKMVNYNSCGWHGATSFSLGELEILTKDKWKIVGTQGVALFPLHRIPVRLRKILVKVDALFCRSIIKEYSSYLILKLEKL